MEDFLRSLNGGGCDALLVNPPYVRRHGGGAVPPVGLCYLAAALRSVGATPTILDLAAAHPDFAYHSGSALLESIQTILSAIPPTVRLIGIGPLVTATLRSTQQIVAACRKVTSCPIILGGPLCAVPGFSGVNNRYTKADAYVAGDGETPIARVWERLSHSAWVSEGIPGLTVRGRPESAAFRERDLDVLGIPAWDLLPNAHYKASARRNTGSSRTTAAFLSRGCPYSCSFCAAPLASGKVVRRLSPARISDHVAACAAAGFDDLIFYDDCLFIKSPRLNDSVASFSEALIASGWNGTFQLELRCDAVVSLSDEALNDLKRAGCRQINMGIEKGDAQQLLQLRKKLTPEIARQACERLDQTGIRAAGTFIIGGIGEGKDHIQKTIQFAVSLPLDFAQFNPLAIYPGTALYDEVFGCPLGDSWLDHCLNPVLAPIGDILWRSNDTPLEHIIDAIARAYTEFYSADRKNRVLNKVSLAERASIAEAFHLLANERALSWTNRTPFPAGQVNVGATTC